MFFAIKIHQRALSGRQEIGFLRARENHENHLVNLTLAGGIGGSTPRLHRQWPMQVIENR